jgi:hypothetical protein
MRRNQIKTAAGPLLLTVPCHFRRGMAVKDVAIADNGWRHAHRQSLRMAYGKAPYFGEVADWLLPLLDVKWTWFLDYALASAVVTATYVNRPALARVVLASELAVRATERTAKLVEMVRLVEGSAYVTGRLALENYMTPEPFAEAGIALLAQRVRMTPYPQRWGEFVGYLSALDLVFNVGAQGAADWLAANVSHVPYEEEANDSGQRRDEGGNGAQTAVSEEAGVSADCWQ